MSYRSRAYSDATKYDYLGSPVSHRYQGYDVPDYSSTNRYRGEYPSDAPKEYTLHKSDRIYTSRSTHGGSDSHFDTRDEFQPSYISRRYYYDYSFDDDELYFSDHDHHRKHQSARSGTEAPIIINIFSDKSTSSGHSHQSKTTRSTKDRSERDILALPQSLQPVARQVDAEFSRLEKEAEDLEKEYARHKYDVKKYEDVKKRIAAQWQIYCKLSFQTPSSPFCTAL